MKKIKSLFLFICGFVLLSMPISAQAADNTDSIISIQVEVPGEDEPFTLEMQKSDYVGTIKFKLQEQVDVDLNKMDLLYNGQILSEVVRFSSAKIPSGATITMQTSSRWNYDEVKTVDDITFSIARPKEETLTKIYAKDYGMSPDKEDNTAAFQAAINKCSANSYLVIEPGTYYFRNMEDDLAFNNMENVIIDGNGATFIFDNKYCMKVYGGNGVEFRNLTVDWDWDKVPVGSLIQIDKVHSDTVFDIRFVGMDEVDENINIGTFMYLDSKDLSVGSHGYYKAYTPGAVGGKYLKKVEKVDHNVLRITHASSDMKRFHEGEYFLLRHFEYSGRVFNTTRYAKNITYDNINIYGFTGMGWVFADKANHFQIINSYLGLNPEKSAERRISVAADAIHILNTGGYFRISNNDLSFTGDDIINIHDDVMDILEIDEGGTSFRGWSTSRFTGEGEIIRFRNSQHAEFTDYTAKVVSCTTDANNSYERIVTLEKPLPDYITEDCFVCSASHSSSYYVISNNYIHEARARAALLNDDYGLFENNYVYRVSSGAIGVRASFSLGRWFEGEGSQHVVIRNNTFEECNYCSLEPVINIGITVAGEYSTEKIIDDVRVQDNVFLNCIHREDKDQTLVYANNVDNLIVTGNVNVDSGEIATKVAVGNTTIKNNVTHTEHTFVKGVCSVCNQAWETEIDGITYRVVTEIVKNKRIGVSVPKKTAGEIAISVADAKDVEGKAIVLPSEIIDDVTGQKYILTTIKMNAFADSKAASVAIPNTVTTLGNNALGDIKKVIRTGWQQSNGKWYYVNTDGTNKAGWLKYNQAWYYFDTAGVMQIGWKQISGKWYYFATSGAMVSGWQKISNKWYYFNAGGDMVTGWKQINGKWYYFTTAGSMVTAWQKISNKWYYFNVGGDMVTGWKQISGKWYYFTSSGNMVTGWHKISNKWYYFNAGGDMVTGTKTIDGKTYTFDSNGVWLQ